MKRISLSLRKSAIWLLVPVLTVSVIRPCSGQSSLIKNLPPEAQLEIQYARGLFDLYLPDIAQSVIGDLERDFPEYPEIRNIVEVLKIEGFIMAGQFDQAKAVISRQPNQRSQGVWAMKLALADGYYMWGKYTEAQGVYNEFFSAYPKEPPKELKAFYVESAHRYAQMLILMGKENTALAAYRRVLDAKPERHIERQAQSEMAELMVKMADKLEGEAREKMLKKVETLCTDILWRQDLWFGKAIVYMAHVRKMRGNINGAQELIDEYTKQLKGIDDALKAQKEEEGIDMTHLSPMAECRYLIGVIQHDEAKRLLEAKMGQEAFKLFYNAYVHFMNVFVRYPSTKWAPDAGVRAREIEEVLGSVYNKKPRTGVTPEQMGNVVRYQFQSARSLFNQQSYEQAIDAYLDVLSLFPEVEPSVAALSELARCYLESQQPFYARMVAGHLAERYGADEKLKGLAGDRLIRLAEDAATQYKLPALQEEFYKLYFDNLENHSRAPDLLYRFGRKAMEANDIKKALGYFERIKADHPNSLIFLPAISQVANCYAQEGDRTNEVKVLDEYIALLEKESSPGHAYINGQYRLAVAYKELAGNENLQKAISQCTLIIDVIQKDDKRYYKSMDDREKNMKVLEGALFLKAVCSTLLTEPEEKLEDFKRQAISELNELVDKFPKSQFAPVALSRIGVLHTLLGEAEPAEEALRRLEKAYPDSPEAKNAKYMLGKALLDLGKRKEAVDVFKQMFGDQAGRYNAGQILTAGQELAKAGEHEIALEAFESVLKTAGGERAYEEPALMGKGIALLKQENYEGAARALHELLKKFPNSGFTVDACFAASKASAELARREPDTTKRFDLFNESVKYLKNMMKYELRAESGVAPDLARARANVQIARITALKARSEQEFIKGPDAEAVVTRYLDEAIAAFQTVILLTDERVAGVGPHLQDAFHDCIPLMIETATANNDRAKQAIEDCDRYIEMFPTGKYLLDIRRFRSEALIKKTQFEAVSGAGGANGAGKSDAGGDEPK